MTATADLRGEAFHLRAWPNTTPTIGTVWPDDRPPLTPAIVIDGTPYPGVLDVDSGVWVHTLAIGADGIYPVALTDGGTELTAGSLFVDGGGSTHGPTETVQVTLGPGVVLDVTVLGATGGSGGGSVDSVNGQTGVVVLDATDVGADPAGTAAGLVGALGTAAQADTGDFATAAQGDTADSALQPADLSGTGLASYDDGTGVIDVPASAVESIADDAASDRIAYAGQPGSLGLRPNHLDGWWTALANRDSAPARVLVIGDSLLGLVAVGAPPVGHNIERILNNELPAGTTSSIGQIIGSWRSADSTDGQDLRPRFTTCDGTPTTTAVAGWGMVMDPGDKGTVVAQMDGISLVYASAPGAGQIEVRDGIGGTLLATIDADDTVNSSRVWTSEALTFTAHTIEITVTGAPVTVSGAMVHRRNRAAGVQVWNASRSGATSVSFTANPERGLDLIDSISPDLVLLGTGTNDAVNYDADMRALVAAVRLRHAGSIALWIPHLSNNFTEARVTEAYQIAADFDLGVIDAAELIGQPIEQSGLSGVGVHQNTNGGQLETVHLAAALSGDPLSALARVARPANTLSLSNGPSTASIAPGAGAMELRVDNPTNSTWVRSDSITIAGPDGSLTIHPNSITDGATGQYWVASGPYAGRVVVSSGAGLLLGAVDGKLSTGRMQLHSLDSDPTDAALVGEMCVVAGVLKICTVAGTPGTWTPLAAGNHSHTAADVGAVALAAGITVIDAGDDLTTARPAGIGVAY